MTEQQMQYSLEKITQSGRHKSKWCFVATCFCSS